MKRNVAIGQSGGPSAVINASLYGVIKEAFKLADVGTVYGLHHGIEGLIHGDLIDLKFFRDENGGLTPEFERLKDTPASYLGSCRYKLKEKNREDFDAIFSNFEKFNIGYFFYIGGNDSMDTVSQLAKQARERGLDIKVMGVPKTVDNDLAVTDHTPGYGSAAKYIATSVREVMLDTYVYNKPSVTIVETMGRHAGWLAAAGALALESPNHDGMMIYFPEIVFDLDQFKKEVEERLARRKRLLIVVSEGLRFADGTFVCEGKTAGERDSFGHAALSGCGCVLKDALSGIKGIKARAVELNVLQRAAGHCRSLTDRNESILAGETAVKCAAAGTTGEMIVYRRAEGPEYRVTMHSSDVHQICNVEKRFPLHWITEDRFVTQEYFDYARPLILGEPDMKTVNGLPQYTHLPDNII